MRQSIQRAVWWCLVGWALASCNSQIQCRLNSDCALDHECVDGMCVPLDGGSAGAGGSAGEGGGGGAGGSGGSDSSQPCADARPITGDFVTGELDGGPNNFRHANENGCEGPVAAVKSMSDAVYRVTVPANQRLTATLSNGLDGGQVAFNAQLNLITSLAACGTNVDAGTVGLRCAMGLGPDFSADRPQRVVHDNGAAQPQDVYLVVDGFTEWLLGVEKAAAGRYRLDVAFGTIPTAVTGGACPGAPTLPLNQWVRSDTGTSNRWALLESYAVAGPTNCNPTGAGPDVTFTLNVPPRQHVVVEVRPTSTFEATLNVLETSSCNTDAGSCSAFPLGELKPVNPGHPKVLEFDNTSTGAKSLLVLVDTAATTVDGGTFDLIATTSPLPNAAPSGESCATPGTLPVGRSTLTTQGHQNNIALGKSAGCAADVSTTAPAAPDAVHTITIPANTAVRVQLRSMKPGVTAAVDILRNVAACGTLAATGWSTGASCLNSITLTNNRPQTLLFANHTAVAADHLLVLDGHGTAAPVEVEAEVTHTTLPPIAAGGETCSTPGLLNLGTHLLQTTTAVNNYQVVPAAGDRCEATGPARDAVYSVSVPPSSAAILTASGVSDDRLAINVMPGTLASCGTTQPDGGTTGAVCVDSFVTGLTPLTGRLINATLLAQTYFLMLDGQPTVGPAGISLAKLDYRTEAVTVVTGGESCSSARPLVLGTSLVNTQGAVNDHVYDGGAGCAASSAGPDIAFTVQVPPRSRSLVTASEPSSSSVVAPVLNGFESTTACGATAFSCTGVRSNRVLDFVNPTDVPVTRWVVVDATPTSAAGPIELNHATSPLVTSNAGETCATAAPLTEGTYYGTTAGRMRELQFTTAQGCRATGAGPEVVYSVVVPAGRRGAVQARAVDRNSLNRVVVNVVASEAACSAPSACVGSSSSAAGVLIDNRTTSDQTYWVVVGSSDASPVGFDITYAWVPFTVGDTCADAVPIGGNEVLRSQTLDDTNRTLGMALDGHRNDIAFQGISCVGPTGTSRDRVYRVVVPAGQRLSVTAQPDRLGDISIHLVDAAECDSSIDTCLAAANASPVGIAENVSYTNTGSASREVFIIIKNSAGVFNLTTRTETP